MSKKDIDALLDEIEAIAISTTQKPKKPKNTTKTTPKKNTTKTTPEEPTTKITAEKTKAISKTKTTTKKPEAAAENKSSPKSTKTSKESIKIEADQTMQATLAGCILIAMPEAQENIFSQSVIYICDHSDQGSLGVILNRPINLSLGELLEKLELAPKKGNPYLEQPILLGGPIESDKGFVLHPNQDDKFTSNIERDLTITTSMDILEHLAKKTGPKKFLIALGCATWEAGQLLDEIRKNRWIVWTLSDDSKKRAENLEHFIFEVAHQKKYTTALKNLGIEAWQLSMFGGNA